MAFFPLRLNYRNDVSGATAFMANAFRRLLPMNSELPSSYFHVMEFAFGGCGGYEITMGDARLFGMIGANIGFK